jgi:hypothetical protein
MHSAIQNTFAKSDDPVEEKNNVKIEIDDLKEYAELAEWETKYDVAGSYLRERIARDEDNLDVWLRCTDKGLIILPFA